MKKIPTLLASLLLAVGLASTDSAACAEQRALSTLAPLVGKAAP